MAAWMLAGGAALRAAPWIDRKPDHERRDVSVRS
jgi:hypothetical protein